MNYAGNPLLSKATITSGRSLFLLSLAIILTNRYEIDLSNFEVLGISLTEDKLNPTLSWILGILWITNFVHWVGDLVSLGKWNSSMSVKLTETLWDGGGKLKRRMEFVIECFEKAIDPEQAGEKAVSIDFVEKTLREINNSLWWHEKIAIIYVVGWYFPVPTGLAGYAIYFVNHA